MARGRGPTEARATPPRTLGYPLRLKAADRRLRRPRPGPDRRAPADVEAALGRARPAEGAAAARGARARLRGGAVGGRARAAATGGRRPSRSRGTSTTRDPRRDRSRPRRSARWSPRDARRRSRDGLAAAMDLVGHADRRAVPAARRRAVVNELAPRVHNTRPLDDRGRRDVASSSSTSARSAGCRSARPTRTAPAAMVNLLGTGAGPRRPGSPGVDEALADPGTSTSTSTTSDGCSSGARWAT